MHRMIRSLLLALGLGVAGLAWAQGSAAPADAASAAAAGLPRPDETNAQRAKSQPGNNAPLWRAVRDSGNQAGYASLPGIDKGVLIQPFVQYPGSAFTNAGEAWRQVRNRWIIPYGGALLLIVLGALALFYWRKGPLGGHASDTGRQIERFTPFERSAHWANAVAFVVLAVSGVVMAFGTFFLLPVMLLMVYLSTPLFIKWYQSGEMSSQAGGLIRWPAMLTLPLGFALMTLQGVAEVIKRIGWLMHKYDLDIHYERPLQ